MRFQPYVLSIGLFAVVLGAAPTRAQDIATLKGRFYTRFLEEGAKDQGTVANYLNTIQADGHWNDINYSDRSRTIWDPVNHLYRVEDMAKAYRTVGHYYYNSAAVQTACSNALNYWYAHDPQSDNWWWNELGTQFTLMKSLILLESALSSGQISSGCTILARATLDQTGTNLVWACKITSVRGCLQSNTSTVTTAINTMKNTVVITTGDGVQPDYSFHQHGTIFLSGAYGAAYSADTAFFANVTRGLQWAFPQDKIDIISGNLLDGQRWMTRGRNWDYAAIGRGISRKDQTGWELVNPSYWMYEMGTSRQGEFSAFWNQLTQNTPANQPAVTGNRHFCFSDYMAHSRPAWLMSTHMYSSRLYNTDGNTDGSPVNGEGKRSHHISDGVTFIHRDGEEYFNIFGVWDWYRPPGATVEYGSSLDPASMCYKSTKNFVGGVSDGQYGVAAIDYSKGTVNAKKSTFYFDNEAVCLGTGITSSTANSVLTSMNQCLLRSGVTVKDSGGTRTLAGSDWTLTGLQWAHQDNVGYVFPTAVTGRLKNQAQSGTWNYINDVYPASEIDTKNVFSLWVDHGSYVSNGSYQYVVVPEITSTALDSYSLALPVSVRSNTTTVQAVEHADLGVVEAVFYAAGTFTCADGMIITVDQPCIVLVRKLLNQFKVCVANPKNAALAVNVDINRHLTGSGSTWDAGTRFTRIPFSLPSGWDAGRSVVLVLDGVDEAKTTSNTIPSTMNPGQVVSVNVTMKNIGGTTWTKASNHKLGAVGDSDPFAPPRQLLSDTDAIAPGQSKTFTFNMTAPTTPGTYLTDWQMLREGVAWFGEVYSKNVTVGTPSTVYSDTFTNNPGTLNGRAIETGGVTWAAANMQVTSGAAKPTGGTNRIKANIPINASGASSVSVKADMRDNVSGSMVLILTGTSLGNFDQTNGGLYLEVARAGDWYIRSYSGGVVTTHHNGGVIPGWVIGSTHNFELILTVATKLVKVKMDGTPLVSNVSLGSFVPSLSYAGWQAKRFSGTQTFGVSDAHFDNFVTTVQY
jgi:chondroitin AC lyase